MDCTGSDLPRRPGRTRSPTSLPDPGDGRPSQLGLSPASRSAPARVWATDDDRTVSASTPHGPARRDDHRSTPSGSRPAGRASGSRAVTRRVTRSIDPRTNRRRPDDPRRRRSTCPRSPSAAGRVWATRGGEGLSGGSTRARARSRDRSTWASEYLPGLRRRRGLGGQLPSTARSPASTRRQRGQRARRRRAVAGGRGRLRRG